MRALILMLLFFLSASVLYAQEFNAGIVQGLWYSDKSVFAGQTVRVYVAIRNNTGSDLTGTVEFFDNNRRIGQKTVAALNGRIIETWADWKPDYGEHTLSATLSRIELDTVGESTQAVTVISSLAEDTIFVDFDTDGDGVGNQEDTDDDGDGISDTEEVRRGTDPLLKDEPADTEVSVSEEAPANATLIETSPAEEITTSREGFEQYLSDGSPAENLLSGVTNYITQARENLDAYRERRTAEEQKEDGYTNASTTNGFGEVSRSTNAPQPDTVWTHNFSINDFFGSVWSLAVSLFNLVYTFLLATLSWLLKYPILVQLGLLLLLFFGLIKLAHSFGRRPKHKKYFR